MSICLWKSHLWERDGRNCVYAIKHSGRKGSRTRRTATSTAQKRYRVYRTQVVLLLYSHSGRTVLLPAGSVTLCVFLSPFSIRRTYIPFRLAWYTVFPKELLLESAIHLAGRTSSSSSSYLFILVKWSRRVPWLSAYTLGRCWGDDESNRLIILIAY